MSRLDRIATVYLFHRLKRIINNISAQSVPILMYHSISDGIEDNLHPYYRLNTALSVFKEHMGYLRENGYSTITFEEYGDYLLTGKTDGDKRVIITFDDGYKDFLTNAFPVLVGYGFRSSVFIPTGLLGKKSLNNKEHLSWNDVRALHSSGVVFGSHTVTHSRLNSLNHDDMVDEVCNSKKDIEDVIGGRVDLFSYPYAFPEEDAAFISRLRDTLSQSEYKYGVTTKIGISNRDDNLLFMRRIPVNSDDDIIFFRAKLEGGYDWLNKLQYLKKRLNYSKLTIK